mmetsp:Transcript_6911/g.15835  ORF Transcript_6911/g.15835 Transcript_6911/m.15835 type:complete len:207 (-) Transcript_6911:37-657(-)
MESLTGATRPGQPTPVTTRTARRRRPCRAKRRSSQRASRRPRPGSGKRAEFSLPGAPCPPASIPGPIPGPGSWRSARAGPRRSASGGASTRWRARPREKSPWCKTRKARKGSQPVPSALAPRWKCSRAATAGPGRWVWWSSSTRTAHIASCLTRARSCQMSRAAASGPLELDGPRGHFYYYSTRLHRSRKKERGSKNLKISSEKST